MREAERALARQAEVAYKRMVADWTNRAKEKGRRRDTGARILKSAVKGQAARQAQAPGLAL